MIDNSSQKKLNFAENVFGIMSQKLKLLDFESFHQILFLKAK